MPKKRILEIWANRDNIFEGIKNSIFKKDTIEQIANSRMVICSACPHIDRSGKYCVVPNAQPCCGKCGCTLSWKIRALSESCGDTENPRWTAMVNEQEEEQIKKDLNIED